jgi:peptidoglycan/LPS O-acetylase OafA/YrhL
MLTNVTTSATSRPHDSHRPDVGRRESPAAAPPQLPRIDGLDGLRAVAIAAVVVFHLNASWMPGGFLGVDVFFVVSGFLITSLLVLEHGRTDRLDLPRFWVRRAQRLLPALVLVVVTSVLIARTVSSDLLVGIGRQVAGALTFSTNWVEITAGSSYFDQTAPQLFMNFWSLAVEEQFYLLWPLVTVALLAFATSRTRVAVALGLGTVSALLMAVLLDPMGDATRVYYGTDTHLVGLMLGAAVAFAWTSPRLRHLVTPHRWGAAGHLAVPAAGVVLAALLLLLDEGTPFTFRGGIVLACVATAVLVLGVVDQGAHGAAEGAAGGGATTPLQRAMASPVATWVGRRSYSIYLWHWPVILIVASDHPSAPGTIEHVLVRLWCVVVTLALSDLTYRFVEIPFRRDGFRGTGRRVLALLLRSSRRTRQVVSATVAVAAVVTGVVLLTAPDRSQTAIMLEQNEAAADAAAPVSPGAGSPTGAPTPGASGAPSATGGPTASATAGASATSKTAPSTAPSTASAGPLAPNQRKAAFTMPAGTEIDAYGDSIMVGSLGALKYYFPGIRIDAKSNRRWSDGLTEVTSRGDDNRRAVVLAFGTNWGTDADQVKAVLDRLGPDRMVVLVNIMGPMSRVDRDNATLASVAEGRPNVAVADWASAVRSHPDQLQSDRIHPSLTGAHLFSKTVRQALADLSERNTGTKVSLPDLPMP